MTNDNLDADLRREQETLTKERSQLQDRVSEIDARLGVLSEYFAVMQKVRGDVPADDAPKRNGVVSVDGKSRIRSTSLISGIVVGSNRRWTKEQLWEAFVEKYGMPDWETPQNAFGTALSRAVKQGAIKLDRGLYADADAA
ncbi:hypothetical protein [Leifsonia xyli]|uniref:hypothetical protein n=1 Tax=Leifsonia xyli TaxID=1575 RepID=UPI003D6726F3